MEDDMDLDTPPLKRRRTSEERSSPVRSHSRNRQFPSRGPSPDKTPTSDREVIQRNGRGRTSRSRENSATAKRQDYHYEQGRKDTFHRRSRSRSQSTSQSRSRASSSRSRSFHSFASPSPADDATPPPEVNGIEKSAGKTLIYKPFYTVRRAHARGITSVKFSPDRSLLACASADASITIYTVQASNTAQPLKLLRTLRAHLAGVNAIAWSPVGPNYTLASASDDKSILLWSPLSSDFPISPSPLIGHSNYVFSLAFSPKGNMLVSGSYDEAVFLWDVRSARVMRTLPAHSDPVSGVDFLRDGSMVCSCASDGLIRIWDSGTGQCLATLVDEDRRPVTSVRFSPNGEFVLGWGLDGCIRLWRYAAGKCVKTYTGHVNSEYSLGGTIGDYDNGREAFVVSGSEDGDLLVWDVSSKEILWRGKGHSDVVLSVDFARPLGAYRGSERERNLDGNRALMASGGKDRDLRLWIEQGPNLEDHDDTSRHDDPKSELQVKLSTNPIVNRTVTSVPTSLSIDTQAGLRTTIDRKDTQPRMPQDIKMEDDIES